MPTPFLIFTSLKKRIYDKRWAIGLYTQVLLNTLMKRYCPNQTLNKDHYRSNYLGKPSGD